MHNAHTIATELKRVRDVLKEHQIDNSELDARLILAHGLNLSPIELLVEHQKPVSANQISRINSLLMRRIDHEPIASIFGEKEFWSLTFKVTDDTLCPRPDSETLIEQILRDYPDNSTPLSILDLGTGTGCLILSLLHEYPKAQGTALDLSEAALNIARENAKRHHLEQRCHFIQSEWTTKLLDQKFDIIMSNPPYIPLTDQETLSPEVTLHDPHLALFAGDDGLQAYRQLAPQLAPYLKANGHIYLEIGHDQAKDVSHIFIQHGLKVTKTTKDLGQNDRCLTLQST